MARIIIFILLAWILYQIIKRVAAKANDKPNAKAEENFIKCAKCGCHVPESDSQIVNQKTICNNPECINTTRDNKPDGA